MEEEGAARFVPHPKYCWRGLLTLLGTTAARAPRPLSLPAEWVDRTRVIASLQTDEPAADEGPAYTFAEIEGEFDRDFHEFAVYLNCE